MEDIPPPVQYHFSRNGFSHASSENIYNWTKAVDNSRENRVHSLHQMDPYQDVITKAQKNWVSKKREIRGVKFMTPTDEFLKDYGESGVMKQKIG